MREYCWYSAEHDWIVFQLICQCCDIYFEWDYADMIEATNIWGTDCEPMEKTTWIPLGEV